MAFYEDGLIISPNIEQRTPPYRDTLRKLQRGRNDFFPRERQLLSERHLMSLLKDGKRDIFFRTFTVEKVRQFYRSKSKGVASCIVFASETAQPLDMYISCADALSYVGDSYRIIVCDTSATRQDLLQKSSDMGIKINLDIFECREYITGLDDLLNVFRSIEEQISLCYIASGGETGAWAGDSIISNNSVEIIGSYLKNKITPDCQVFLRSDYSARGPTMALANIIPNVFVLGALQRIPPDTIIYVFAADCLTDRLYVSFNCSDYETCQIVANIKPLRPSELKF